jgi:hypothetical protein
MELEERAADPLAGGIMHGYQCGMIWGAALATGAQAYRLYGSGPQAETAAVTATQRALESFRIRNNHTNCLETTGIDLSSPTISTWAIVRFLVRSAPTGSCFGIAARYAPAAFTEINTSLSKAHVEAPSAPTSCAAMLAQRMDASDTHAAMAAGLAGGIGLSGGACGALGAAIWITGMNLLKKGDGFAHPAPHASDAIERFMKRTDHEFECSKIVGRKFENIQDHADYLHDGGCSEIVEALATP